MLCSNCSKLATMVTHKKCVRCQGAVYININVLCDNCSNNEKQCAVCIKKIVTNIQRATTKGCGCGKK